jgi:hypothetical protein
MNETCSSPVASHIHPPVSDTICQLQEISLVKNQIKYIITWPEISLINMEQGISDEH